MLLETDKKILGKKFKYYRKLKNLTQFQLAEQVGLNEKQISRIEAGQNHPTYLTFAKLVEILEINLSNFSVEQPQQTNKLRSELIRTIKNSNDIELKIYHDILRPLRKNLNQILQQN